jgi:glycosyltransferase involved in cell wall biosynthesis
LAYSEYQDVPVWHVRLPRRREKPWQRGLDFVRFHAWSLVAALVLLGRQDVVITTSPPLTIGVMSWLLALRWKAVSIYKVAEMYPDLAIRQGVVRHRWMIALMRRVERLVYRRNSLIVTIAEQFAALVRERGTPASKVVVIPDFVDVEFYRPQPRINPFSEQYGLNGTFVVLYAGNIGLVQDWESVLEAAARVRDLALSFVVVGDGVRRDWLERQVRERGLDNVRLIPYQSRDLMPYVNAAADVVLIPMTQAGAADGFPSKVYSTMASARPVIVATGTGSEMAQLVTRAGCGRAVPVEDPAALVDAIRAAYADRDALRAQGIRGREFVEQHYSKAAIVGQYETVIAGLVGDPSQLRRAAVHYG